MAIELLRTIMRKKSSNNKNTISTRSVWLWMIAVLCCFQLPGAGMYFLLKQTPNYDEVVGLENEFVSISFDKDTGQLISLFNKKTGDENLKNQGAGNPFRLYLNPKSGPELIAGAHDQPYGGTIIDPSVCRLQSHTVTKNTDSQILDLVYDVMPTDIRIELKIELLDDLPQFDAHLAVVNQSNETLNVLTAFPYLTGVQLGEDPGTNLTVNMWDRGYPGIKAWERPLGGVYGKSVSMQWQTVYEPKLKQGVAFIAMDPDFSNKILSTFPFGGMASLYFDKRTIAPNNTSEWPSCRFLVYNGNWRTAARAYDQWFAQTVEVRTVPEWYREEIAIRSSTWFPSAETVMRNKQSSDTILFTSFKQLHSLFGSPIFGNKYNDCMEFAMWNEGVNLWPETYGPWMSSGFIDFRSDLGGLEAFKKGLAQCHKYGRRVAMYVAAYGIRSNSPMMEDDWEKFAIKKANGKPVMDYRKGNEKFGAFNCPGYKPWQDYLIRICTMLAEAGVDEIRLDEFGFPFRPCFNEEHQHRSPYNANQWVRTCLKRIRENTDQINPDLFISTEFFMDFFHESTNGALVMDCSGDEIDAMKIALPEYLPLSYHASAPEAAITGAIISKIDNQRTNWAWAQVGTEKPEDYNKDVVVDLKWHELYPTLAEAVTYGEISEWDPVALNDPKWMGRLWQADNFWALTGGHVDATPLKTDSVIIKIPVLPDNIKLAYEFDLINLAMRRVDIDRSDDGIFVMLQSPVSAILFPTPSCPPLPIVNQEKASVDRGSEIKVSVSLFGPWRVNPSRLNVDDLKLYAPGFEVAHRDVNTERIFTIKTDLETPLNKFYFLISGECLKMKRWFEVTE